MAYTSLSSVSELPLNVVDSTTTLATLGKNISCEITKFDPASSKYSSMKMSLNDILGVISNYINTKLSEIAHQTSAYVKISGETRAISVGNSPLKIIAPQGVQIIVDTIANNYNKQVGNRYYPTNVTITQNEISASSVINNRNLSSTQFGSSIKLDSSGNVILQSVNNKPVTVMNTNTQINIQGVQKTYNNIISGIATTALWN